jgi:hypothetical protein
MRICVLFLLLAVGAKPQLEAPQLGCFWDGDYAFVVTGVRGAFLVGRVEACVPPPNLWRITHEIDGQWLLKIDPVSGAVDSRSKLGDGAFAVWLDGAVADLGSLGLPAPVVRTELLSQRWTMIFLDGGSRVILARDGAWFLLPGGAQ